MLDSLTIAALTDELGHKLTGGRVQKIVQIDDASVGLEIYAEHQRHFLVASADSRNPRLYLASTRISADPDRVSPLLLLLRKYARGGQVVDVQQPPLERIVRLSIAKRFWPDKHDHDPDDEAEIVSVDLIVELMGRRSNIILTGDEGRVLDAVKRVTAEMSRVRPVLPGRAYVLPPAQDKVDPRELTPDALHAVLRSSPPGEPLAGLLVRALAGFSPQMAREAVYRATGDSRALNPEDEKTETAAALEIAIAEILAPLESGRWEPSLYLEEGELVAYAPIRLLSFAGEAEEESVAAISEAIERAATAGSQPGQLRYARRRQKLAAEIAAAADRVRARLHSLREEQERGTKAERWREMGELIYAYLYQINQGDTELDTGEVRIPLDPAKSPSENAQEYFERYRKARSATENLPELIEAAQTELAYLDELRTMVELADGIEDIDQLRREWEDWGRSGQGAHERPRRPQPPKRPRPYRSERGDLIYVGRNGRQNEIVTFDLAGPDDTWLHARAMPGAHVIVRWAGDELPDLLEHAAGLAAWYSAGRGATSVEVDVAPRRYVRKIKGAGPGMVTYRNERTVNVRPASPESLGLSQAG